MFDITPILEAVIKLLIVVAMVVVIPFIKQKLNASQLDKLKSYIGIAVYAAEQLFPEPKSGEKKKNYVLDWLESHNITYNVETIDALIEAAVYEMNLLK